MAYSRNRMFFWFQHHGYALPRALHRAATAVECAIFLMGKSGDFFILITCIIPIHIHYASAGNTCGRISLPTGCGSAAMRRHFLSCWDR